MKLKCRDGKVRRFQVCRPAIFVDAYGNLYTCSWDDEAKCLECGECFGRHDLAIIKSDFLAHVCAAQQGVQRTVERRR